MILSTRGIYVRLERKFFHICISPCFLIYVYPFLGRAVMLEQPRKSGTKVISHMLASHGGEIFIHSINTARSLLEDPPSISEGCGGRVTDYRINVSSHHRLSCDLMYGGVVWVLYIYRHLNYSHHDPICSSVALWENVLTDQWSNVLIFYQKVTDLQLIKILGTRVLKYYILSVLILTMGPGARVVPQ